MKIYVGHSSQYNYQEELYVPLMQSPLWPQHDWYLPHKSTATPINSKGLIEGCDLLLAEVSLSSTGLGIELGWANSAGIPIFAIYHADAKISLSLEIICQDLTAYTNLTAFFSRLKLAP